MPNATTTNAVEVLTHEYEFSHGKKPSGCGSWAFAPFRAKGLEDIEWVHGVTYGEAKREAKRRFAAKGVSVVVVLS